MGSTAPGELARIFPESAAARRTSPEPATGGDPESAQFRLFEAYWRFLRMAGAQAPAPRSPWTTCTGPTSRRCTSCSTWRESCRGCGVLVVGTYRDTDLSRTHPLSEALAVLNRDPGFTRIVLRGLTQRRGRGLHRDAAHVEPRPKLLDRIYEETEGNPFFLSRGRQPHGPGRARSSGSQCPTSASRTASERPWADGWT